MKISAAMFEDLTKQSSNFLANALSKSTVIRLQRTVTSPTHLQHTTTGISSCAPPIFQPQPSVYVYETITTQEHIPANKVHDSVLIKSNVCENLQPGDPTSYLDNEDARLVNNPLYKACDHEGLLKETLQLIVETPAQQHLPTPNKILISDAILVTRLLAEKAKNKERMRRIEGKIHAKEDERNVLNEKDKSSEFTHSRKRSKLSKKKELWQKYTAKKKAISSVESGEISTDDERLLSSDTAENPMKLQQVSQEEKTPASSYNMLGVYPFSNYIDFDRAPPLRPDESCTDPDSVNFSNIVLPSGRGKARENERTIGNSREAQEITSGKNSF